MDQRGKKILAGVICLTLCACLAGLLQYFAG